jgi:hypothetical protein
VTAENSNLDDVTSSAVSPLPSSDSAGAPRRAKWRAALVFAIPLAVYLAGMRYLGSGDTEPAELLPISLLTEGNLDFNEFFPGSGDLPYAYRRVGGRIVSSYPIVAGLLNVPVYAVAKAFGVDLSAERSRLSMITASLAAAFSVLFLYFALLRVCESPGQAFFFAFVYAFGTCVWSVASRGLWQHTPSLLFLCAALSLMLQEDRWKVALAGLMVGLAVTSRPTDILLAAAVAGYVLFRRRGAFPLFAALALLPAALVSVYSWSYLGDPLAFGQAYRSGGFTRLILAGLAGLLVSPSRGLFVFSPVLLAGVAGGMQAWRSKDSKHLRFLSAGAFLLLVLYACWGTWWGGSGFGYRLILEIVPVLILLLPLAWNRWIRRSPLWCAVFFVFLGFSIYAQYLGAHVYPSGFGENLDLEPARLWDVRESELVLCTRKLLHPNRQPARVLKVPAVWWSPEKNDESVPGWLDASPGGKLVRGPLEISGWAKSSLGEVDVRVVLDDGRVAVPERLPRPDVARVVPELGDTSRAGFRTIFQSRDSTPADHAIAVEFRDPRGAVRRLGPIRFRWIQ